MASNLVEDQVAAERISHEQIHMPALFVDQEAVTTVRKIQPRPWARGIDGVDELGVFEPSHVLANPFPGRNRDQTGKVTRTIGGAMIN